MRPTIELFGMTIDAVTMDDAVDAVWQWSQGPRERRCRYVVTPNVDHVVLYQSNPSLRSAYAGASLVLADGAPVVLASRLLGRALPERVAGSDLVPALLERASCDSYPKPLRVFLLGAAPGVADRAATRIHQRWFGVEVVGTLSPPPGFEHDQASSEQILRAIAASQADLVLIGLGAPKQELWINRYANRLPAPAAICVGATIDFLAGEKKRSPRWMRRLGLEWFHRLASEPSRLAKRYLRDAWVFPQLFWKELRKLGAGS